MEEQIVKREADAPAVPQQPRAAKKASSQWPEYGLYLVAFACGFYALYTNHEWAAIVAFAVGGASVGIRCRLRTKENSLDVGRILEPVNETRALVQQSAEQNDQEQQDRKKRRSSPKQKKEAGKEENAS